jgi:hypothetical protein
VRYHRLDYVLQYISEMSTSNPTIACPGRAGSSPVSRFGHTKSYLTLRLSGTSNSGREIFRHTGNSICCAKPRLLLTVRTATLKSSASTVRLRIAPLFVHCNLRRCIDGGDVSSVAINRSDEQFGIFVHRLLIDAK